MIVRWSSLRICSAVTIGIMMSIGPPTDARGEGFVAWRHQAETNSFISRTRLNRSDHDRTGDNAVPMLNSTISGSLASRLTFL